MSIVGLENELTSAVERLYPSVVRIRKVTRVRAGRRGAVEVEGAGSGVVVDPEGWLVTNDHVVRESSRLEVVDSRGREWEATVVGTDPATDLAVVRVAARDLPAAPLADSERLRVGQFALAIGNSLGLPGGPTVSVGVVSALGRSLPGADYVLEGFLQTDAAINPGNSGGPLANAAGEVIGINATVVAFAQGVGFAIPSNTVRFVVDQIREHGRVARGWIGVSAVSLDAAVARQFGIPQTEGVLVASVFEGGPADRAGLASGDVLTRVGPFPTRRLKDLLRALARIPVGGASDFEFTREGETRRGVVRLASAPESAG